MVWVGIIGAEAYIANALSKLIASHPAAQISTFFSESQLSDCTSEKYYKWSMFDAIEKSDIIFNGLPHKNSGSIISEAVKQGKKVIDISDDNSAAMNKGELSASPVYGIPELNKENIMNAFVVSNPSCYCTGAMLGLAPLVHGKLIDMKSVIIDSKAGVTSLSKTDKLVESFLDNNESVKAYKLGRDNHSIEIEQQVGNLFGEKIGVFYTPYIVPMNKGILTTIYAVPAKDLDTDSLIEQYQEYYQNNPFIRIYKDGSIPQTKSVSYSNYCDIGMYVDKPNNRIVVVTAIDNLMKGAAGQVIQDMNIMYGFDERMGLLYSDSSNIAV